MADEDEDGGGATWERHQKRAWETLEARRNPHIPLHSSCTGWWREGASGLPYPYLYPYPYLCPYPYP